MLITWKTFKKKLVRIIRIFCDNEFRFWFYFIIIIFLLISIIFSFVEGWSVVDSLYFSMALMTTAGFGDIAPVTTLGRILIIPLGFFSVTILLVFISIVVSVLKRHHVFNLVNKID